MAMGRNGYYESDGRACKYIEISLFCDHDHNIIVYIEL